MQNEVYIRIFTVAFFIIAKGRGTVEIQQVVFQIAGGGEGKALSAVKQDKGVGGQCILMVAKTDIAGASGNVQNSVGRQRMER